MKWISSFILLALLAVGCDTPLEEKTFTNSELNYVETYTVLKGTDTKQGSYKKTTLDGQLLEESYYENGKMQGEQRIYDKGNLYSIAQFVDGELHGKYQTFYPDSPLNVEGEYVNNVMEGKWKRYYPNGDLMEIVNFKDNNENGPFVEFYPNGNLKAEGSYLNGDNEHGELFLYDINGILIKKMNCEEGICRTTWVKEGKEDWQGYRNDG
jgi:antitoxin component YwqK of YwqJK toxin-antitoxin module